MTVSRAQFCRRLMPALHLASAQGYLRNDPTTRRLLGYAIDNAGSRAFGHSLIDWSRRGLLDVERAEGKRFTYRITKTGWQSLRAGRPVVRQSTGASNALREYLEANPDEELGPSDVAAKFGVSEQAARRAIRRVVELGIAVRVNVVRLKSQPKRKAA